MRPEVYCTLSSRSMVTRVASPLAAARIRLTLGISRDPDRLTDLPPECTGAFARVSSATGCAAAEFAAARFVAGGEVNVGNGIGHPPAPVPHPYPSLHLHSGPKHHDLIVPPAP